MSQFSLDEGDNSDDDNDDAKTRAIPRVFSVNSRANKNFTKIPCQKRRIILAKINIEFLPCMYIFPFL